MNELALFAGAGGGILGGKLLGWRTVCAVEFDEHARNVLVARQNDGCLEPFPIWDDVRTFDGKPWRGIVDVVSGGFPCQDISVANTNPAGLDGERSGLWTEMRRIIREVQPLFAFVENSPMLIIRGVERILGDLAKMGYDVEWGIISASDLGAPHLRERCWIFAYSNQSRLESLRIAAGRVFKESPLWESFGTAFDIGRLEDNGAVRRKSDVLAGDVDRIARLGNGQVPAVAAKAWHVLCQRAAAGTLLKRPAQHTTAAAQNTADTIE
jgi:DNA (cytosine-5)-methyltransferase 1